MAKAVILQQLIKALDMSLFGFEKSIKAGNRTVGNAIDFDREISPNLVEKIVSAHPKVNRNWLITGEGPMFTAYEDAKVDYRIKYIELLENTVKAQEEREVALQKVLDKMVGLQEKIAGVKKK